VANPAEGQSTVGAAASGDRSVAALAALVGATLEVPDGFDTSTTVESLETVERAGNRSLTFVGAAKYARLLERSPALAAVVSADVPLTEAARARAILRVKSADHAMIAILERFAAPELLPEPGIDPSARIHPTAVIAPGARIGPCVTVGAGASIGARTALLDGVAVYQGARIGEDCVLHAHVVVRERCVIGNRVILASGVAIGTDGFGYRPSPDGRGIAKVPHIGNVLIEDDVEIGANSCVDRGKFGATRIGAGTKIDNLCQIGHNVRIGAHCVLAGQVGVAGSSVLEDYVVVGGQAGIAGHITIGRGARIGAQSGVAKSLAPGAEVLGSPAVDAREFRRFFAAQKSGRG